MICKTFTGGRTTKGAISTVEYLLDDRVQKGSSKVIKGDSELTISIIKEAAKKQKWSWSSGVLSFEETLTDPQKLSVISDFEKTFFCGINPNDFNICWVNHEDKGRTELHYISPRIELSTGKAFNPYFVKRDFKKKDLFQDFINMKHGFSSHHDAAQMTHTSNKKWSKDKTPLRSEIDEALVQLIKDGIVQNRDDVITTLREFGFEIGGRTNKDFISIIDEHGKTHRLKGAIYGENFTNIRELTSKVEERKSQSGERNESNFKRILTELSRFINAAKFGNRKKLYGEDGPLVTAITRAEFEAQRANSSLGEKGVKNSKRRDVNNTQRERFEEQRSVRTSRIDAHQSRENSVCSGCNISDNGDISDGEGVKNDDRIRAKIDEYDRARAERNGARTERMEQSTGYITRAKSTDYNAIGSSKREQNRRDRDIIKRTASAIMDNKNDELERFKTDINLAEFAQSFNYVIDKKKSSKNNVVLGNGSDKIVVSLDQDNHYTYFNPHDQKGGSIIDFIQNETKQNLGQVRKVCRAYLNEDVTPVQKFEVYKSNHDTAKIGRIWHMIKSHDMSNLTFRDIDFSKYNNANIQYDSSDDTLYFKLQSVEGICGIEARKEDGKRIIESSKKGIFVDGDLATAERVVVFESAIDMYSYRELNYGIHGDYYVCTQGSIGDVAIESISSINAYNSDLKWVSCTDNDGGGNKIDEAILDITQQLTLKKSEYKDYNEELHSSINRGHSNEFGLSI